MKTPSASAAGDGGAGQSVGGKTVDGMMRRLWRRRRARWCLLVLGLYLAAALWGEAVYQHARATGETPAYNRVNTNLRYLPPVGFRDAETRDALPEAARGRHWLGTDNLGRDVLSRLLQGARIAFRVGVVTSAIAIPLGVLLGCLGGYFGGRMDAWVLWMCATVAAMPGILFVLAIAMVMGKGLLGLYVGIGFTTWVGVCRVVRAEVVKHRERPYIEAARLMGYSHARVLCRHLLPNILHVVLIALSLRFPAAVGSEVFISFLGIGVQHEPSWGVMVANARLRLWQGMWWEMTAVTLAIFGLVLCANLLADELRDLLDPTLRTDRGV